MISVKRIQAVVIKDYRDLLKNAYMLSTAVIPLFFAFLIQPGRTGPDSGGLYADHPFDGHRWFIYPGRGSLRKRKRRTRYEGCSCHRLVQRKFS